MNALAKVMVVILIVLSAAFAVSQMILHARRVNYQQLYRKTNTELQSAQTENKELALQLEERTRERDGHVEALVKLKTDFNAAKEASGDRIIVLEGKASVLQTRLDALNKDVSRLADLVETQGIEIDNHKTAYAELHADYTGAEGRIADLLDDLRAGDDTIVGLTGRLDDLTVQHAQLRDDKARVDRILGDAIERGFQLHLDDMLLVHGKIVNVDDDGLTAVIDKGSTDGVKMGYVLVVYRDDFPICKVNIVEVLENLSVARLKAPGLFDEKAPIRLGDNVTTRLR